MMAASKVGDYKVAAFILIILGAVYGYASSFLQNVSLIYFHMNLMMLAVVLR